MVIRKMRSLEVHVEKGRTTPRVRLSEMTIELAQEDAAVQLQRGVRSEIENPFVPQHARVDEDIAGPNADRRGNVTELLGLGRQDLDPASVRLELPKDRKARA